MTTRKTIQAVRMPLVLRKKQVLAMVGLSASTIYNLQKAGRFPQPIRLSERAAGWLGEDIENWVAAKVAESAQVAEEAKGDEVAA